MECKFLGVIGNVFNDKDIDNCISKGTYKIPQNADEVNYHTQKSLGIDCGFGSSRTAFVLAQMQNRQIEILLAEDYHRPDFNEMLGVTMGILYKYGRSVNKIYIDGANPAFIKALRMQLGLEEDYDTIIKESRQAGRDPEIDLGSVITTQ